MRPIALVATGLLTATLVSAPPATAVGETCRGVTATLVGTPGQVGLLGTEGDDVIVTNGATSVSALGGNDLICVTGGTSPLLDVTVDAGAGNDVVDASAAGNGVLVRLGAGSDTYTGSPYDETVHGGTYDVTTGDVVDVERDVITTGAGGDDRVVSGSDRATPNGDEVVLGADDGDGFGNTVSWTGPMAAGGKLDGGGGAELSTSVGTGSVAVDADAGTLVEDGTPQLAWTGFDSYSLVNTTAAPRAFDFAGSSRDEQLSIRFEDASEGRHDIDMGGGDDTLLLGYDDNTGAKGSSYAGGSGTDHVAVWAGPKLDLDLASGRMVTKQSGRKVRSTLKGFETQLVGARTLVLKGTRKADDLRFYACQATVRGRAGADTIEQSRGDDYFEGGLRCKPQKFRLFGDAGNDTLRGSRGNDYLIGGPGRDTIYGNAGRDRCSGEKLRSCEIELR